MACVRAFLREEAGGRFRGAGGEQVVDLLRERGHVGDRDRPLVGVAAGRLAREAELE
ncbi:hypothetical protein GCM10010319_35260 [Streptomyces blastmyceticus]|uniref:Uncharacterized protein n=1 Tax=Streptomyces blastmyceticus TaxID=68180 RepID=A0ABN0X4L1_9ACTN